MIEIYSNHAFLALLLVHHSHHLILEELQLRLHQDLLSLFIRESAINLRGLSFGSHVLLQVELGIYLNDEKVLCLLELLLLCTW